MYGEGRFLLEGGYLDGLMLLTDFNNNYVEKIYNPNDKSPVTCIVMNKEENIAIVANNLGIIYAYEVKETTFLLIRKIQYNQKSINYLFISDELNAFVSSSEDNFINIYSLPNCNIIHSFEIDEPQFALLSARPIPVCLIYSKNRPVAHLAWRLGGNSSRFVNLFRNLCALHALYDDAQHRVGYA